MPGSAPLEGGDESDVDRMRMGQKEDDANQQTRMEAAKASQLLVRDEAKLEQKNKRNRRDSQMVQVEGKPQGMFECDSQELLSMDEEHLSQPKRQRKITEYAQMQQQKYGVASKVMGDTENKKLKSGDEEKGVVEGAAKSVDKNLPSQSTAPSL